MANEEQLEILNQGVNAWNRWRSENPEIQPDLRNNLFHSDILRGIDLSRVNLEGAQFYDSDLSSANLREANLRFSFISSGDFKRSDFTDTKFDDAAIDRSNFTGSTFIRSTLLGTHFEFTLLRRVDFSNSQLGELLRSKQYIEMSPDYGTVFRSTSLESSDFKSAIFGHTVLADVNLSNAVNLDLCEHRGPSSIGFDTIFQSGKISQEFLRGCGLNDLQIEMAKLAKNGLDSEQVTDLAYKIHQLYLGNGIQYYSCFISYNSKDQDFAKQLHDDLQNNGVRCWFAPEDMKIGDRIRPRIDQEIRLRDKLLVILSENSVKSEWVGDEVESALEEEVVSNRTLLFPIRLDDAVMSARDDWAAKIKRRRHIGDFSNWKDKASYQKAFERLLSDLKATGG